MLKESYSVKYEDTLKRRWFSDEDFDLIVWLDGDETISGFQLCYDKQNLERALTWKAEGGYTHERVDTGETDPAMNRTPILVPDGVFPVREITERFLAESDGIDANIRDFVACRLREYGAGSVTAPPPSP